jgi:DMSO reductase iron-sulfur subunit
MNQTPLESFIDYKADTGMQCGNYQIDIPKLKEGQQYRFHFDMSVCVGCHCCEVACNEQNNNPADIKWRRVGEMESGVFPDMSQLFNSMSCNHCIDPECLKGCPTNSYIKFENGIVYHDDDVCIGCQYCTWNCPYEVPIFNPDRGIVTKCHMCHEKLDEGQTPACVQACPAGAIEIEAVDVAEWLDSGMAKEGVAPHLPDISITKPTTRYTLPDFDESDIKPADEHILKPAHAELPLVFMTVLTQVSVGGFLALFLGTVLNYFGFNLEAPNFWLALAVFLPAALGLPLSALHLGRPILAITAMKNIKTSWLSREAAALGAYALGASVVAGLYLLKVDGFVMVMLQALVLAIGIFGIHSQAMIYRIKARPSWDRNSTNKKFFGAGYVGFLLTAFVMIVNGSDRSVMAILSLTLLFGAYQMFVIYEENTFYKYLQENHKNYYQLSRTKRLLEERFEKIKKARLVTLFVFAIIAPLLAIIITASGALSVTSVVLGISIVGALVSELMGRYLFFRSVVPLGLAGNFFAGNQR